MILYFSGTGNSEYVAKRIEKETEDEAVNLFERLRDGDYSALYSKRPWVIATPTYAWRIPRIVQGWLDRTELSGNRQVYFVMTCGVNIGNAGRYLGEFCGKKHMDYMGCYPIIMPENYIAMFRTPSQEEAADTVRQAEAVIDRAASFIKEEKPFPKLSVNMADRLSSGIINDIFYPLFVHAKKFYATDSCVSCGLCETVCPLSNVHLEEGRPTWGVNCTHCMACICRCPREAIEYGRHSVGLPRYTFSKEKPNR